MAKRHRQWFKSEIAHVVASIFKAKHQTQTACTVLIVVVAVAVVVSLILSTRHCFGIYIYKYIYILIENKTIQSQNKKEHRQMCYNNNKQATANDVLKISSHGQFN